MLTQSPAILEWLDEAFSAAAAARGCRHARRGAGVLCGDRLRDPSVCRICARCNTSRRNSGRVRRARRHGASAGSATGEPARPCWPGARRRALPLATRRAWPRSICCRRCFRRRGSRWIPPPFRAFVRSPPPVNRLRFCRRAPVAATGRRVKSGAERKSDRPDGKLYLQEIRCARETLAAAMRIVEANQGPQINVGRIMRSMSPRAA